MYYASFGMLSIILHLIINNSYLRRGNIKPASATRLRYIHFLMSVMIYYLTDVLWGFLFESRIVPLLYTDTFIYFLSMVTSVLMWTRFVVSYLDKKGIFGRFLTCAGWSIFTFEILALIVNFFYPIIFAFGSDGEYFPGFARYITLAMQVILFFVTSIYTIVIACKNNGKVRRHNAAVAMSGIIMTVFIVLQTLYPLLPFYAIGILIGICIIHSFVEQDLRISREKFARRDNLTGTKNRTAFTELEESVQQNLDDGIDYFPFAIAVCDINDLKVVNDTMGHQAGDCYIKEAAKIICDVFSHSPVFRIGGDEFAVFIRGDDYTDRETLMEQFHERVNENINKNNGPVISVGMARFNPDSDHLISEIFERADALMYQNKKELKEKS